MNVTNITNLIYPKCHPWLEELLKDEAMTKRDYYDTYSDFQVLSQVVNRQEISHDGFCLGIFNCGERSRPVFIGNNSYLFFRISSKEKIKYVSFSSEEKATEFNDRLLNLYKLQNL